MASGYDHSGSVPTADDDDTLTASGGRTRDAAAEEAIARVESKVNAFVQSWGLSRFSEGMARQWLARSLSTCGGDPKDPNTNAQDPLVRLRKWILMQLNQQRIPDGTSHWQRGCPEMIPLLRAQPVWDCSEFPWVQTLESVFPAIKQELLALKDEKGFQPYRAPSWASNISAQDGLGSVGHDAGDWNVFYLFLHKMDFQKNRSLCPQTVAAIEAIGDQYDHAFFSALAPQTHIKKHHGPTNKKLRCHLPLVVPEGQCQLRVGDQVIEVQEGKCFLFDDSFEHEAWNDDSSHSRIVLIVDVWHPDLSAQEKKFFSFLRNSQLRMDKKLSEHSKDNFFTIIQEASEKANHFSSKEAIWS